MNTIKPGAIKKINDSAMAFKMMENIENFLRAAEDYGCKKIDLFQVVDLYERQNMTQVVNGIFALGRLVWDHLSLSLSLARARRLFVALV
jgi:hypothetical protein